MDTGQHVAQKSQIIPNSFIAIFSFWKNAGGFRMRKPPLAALYNLIPFARRTE